MAFPAFRNCYLLSKKQSRSYIEKFRIFCTASENESSNKKRKTLLKTCLGIFTGVLLSCGSVLYMLEKSVQALGIELHPPKYNWGFDSYFTSFDHQALRRGWVVYKNVCSTCHSLRYVRFKNMVNVIFTEDEAKAIAEEFQVDLIH